MGGVCASDDLMSGHFCLPLLFWGLGILKRKREKDDVLASCIKRVFIFFFHPNFGSELIICVEYGNEKKKKNPTSLPEVYTDILLIYLLYIKKKKRHSL